MINGRAYAKGYGFGLAFDSWQDKAGKPLSAGDRVKHAQYGKGIIAGETDKYRADVDFLAHGTIPGVPVRELEKL